MRMRGSYYVNRREFDDLLKVIDHLTQTQVDEVIERIRVRFSLDNPPEPPTAAAAVGAFVPRKPMAGGPGAAVIPEVRYDEEYGVDPEMSVAYRSGSDD